MNKTASFIRLDYLTLKPYYKTYLIFVAIVFGMTYFTKSVSLLCIYVMVTASMTISYPFSIGEKSGLDTLYATLSLRKRAIVIGRYAFAVSMELACVALSFILVAFFSVFLKMDFTLDELLIYLSIASLFFSFMAAVQYPVYFRVGYDKAKYVAYLPLAIIFMLSVSASKIIDRFVPEGGLEYLTRLIDNYPALLCILPLLAGIMLLLISCAISIKVYAKRDI